MNQAIRHIQKQVDRSLGKIVKKGIVKASVSNGEYAADEIARVLFYTAMLRTFVESVVSQLRDVWGYSVPSADTVFRRLKEAREASLTALLSFNRELIQRARREGWFRRRVVVAIDMWDREYYGKKRDIDCSTGKEKNGTRYFHRVATLAVVEHGKRLEIAMIPVSLFARKEKIVQRLLEEAVKYIKIKVVLLDRGFNSSGVIKVIDTLRLKYIMPMTKNNRVKQEIKHTSGLWYKTVKNYRFRLRERLTVTLIIINTTLLGKKTEERYFAYITNIPVKNTKGSVLTIASFYEARWGIETGYRVKKWEFRAKTCSQSTTVRFFFIILSIILYNIWTLLRFTKTNHYKNGIPAHILREAYTQVIRANGI